MAIFKLGAMFDAISGKVGGQSLCNYSQQQILRNITYTNATPTPKQSIQRALTAALSNSWRFLTSAQRAGWSSTALNYTYVNRVGETVTRNGYQTFCFVNQNLSLIGGALLDTAPLYIPVSEPKINITDISSGNFEIQSNNASSAYYYALFGIANLSPGQSPQKGMMRFLGYITAAQLTAGYDVISDLENVFGALSFPNNIGIIVDPINNTTGNRKQFIDIIQNIDTPMIIEVLVTDGVTVTMPFVSGGTYNGSIDWGDGNVTTFNAWNAAGVSHTYTLGNTYRILIFGAFPKFRAGGNTMKNYLTDVVQFGSNKLTALNFTSCNLLTNVSCVDTPTLDVGCSFVDLFRQTTGILTFNNINDWDVSNVTTFAAMFFQSNCNLDISNWITNNVLTMTSVFSSSSMKFDISGWNISSATNCSLMFNATNYNWLISNFSPSSATNISSMFNGNTLLNQDVSTWDVSNVTNFANVFKGCTSFNQSLANWDISAATNMTDMLKTAGLSNTNWDATLNGWAALTTPPSGITISCNATHTAASAAAYTTLTTTYGWTINEGV